MRGESICPECGQNQHVPIENDLCVRCHGRVYTDALERDDEVSASIVNEYRLTARRLLTPPEPQETP